MDRRSFVIGSVAARLQPDHRWRKDASPIARDHHHQCVLRRAAPTHVTRRSRPPGAAAEAAGGGRDQGRRRRPGRRAGRCLAKPDGYTLLSHNTGISGYAEVDRLFGRPPEDHARRFHPLARIVADPVAVTVVNDQQPYKTAKDFIDDARQRPERDPVSASGGLYGAKPSADGNVPNRPPAG